MDLSTYYKQHPEERYEHIRRMGEILSRVEQTLTKAETLLEEWKTLQDDFKTLVAYYDSPLWRDDYFDSNEYKPVNENRENLDLKQSIKKAM